MKLPKNPVWKSPEDDHLLYDVASRQQTSSQIRFSNISLFCAWSASTTTAITGTSSKQRGKALKWLINKLLPKHPPKAFGVTESTTGNNSMALPTTPSQIMEGNMLSNSSANPTLLMSSQKQPANLAAMRRSRIFSESITSLTRWHANRLMAVPAEEPYSYSLDELQGVALQLIAVARRIAPSGAALYYVFHVGNIEMPAERITWWGRLIKRLRFTTRRIWRQTSERDFGSNEFGSQSILDSNTFQILLDIQQTVRIECRLALPILSTSDMANMGSMPDAVCYEHYSQQRRRRGYLVFDPLFSLLVDSAQEDVHTLLSIVQQAPLTHAGLDPEAYDGVLMRVSLWDSNSDVQETLNDLVRINRSSNASAQGQILVSFALASISALLALTPLPGARPGQLVAPMALCALSAFLSWSFASTQNRLFQRFSILCLVLAFILAILLFEDPSFALPLLPAGSQSIPTPLPSTPRVPILPTPTPTLPHG